MEIITPVRKHVHPATDKRIAAVVHELPGRFDDGFLIVRKDSSHFAQAKWLPKGYLLEYQDGGTAHHFQCVELINPKREIIRVLRQYMHDDPAWCSGYQFNQIDPQPWLFRASFRIGWVAGKLKQGLEKVLRGF